MKKFDTEQMIFTIVLAMVIIGIFIYRVLHPF
jgi:hypothetical protein